jgi:hypothetical protein
MSTKRRRLNPLDEPGGNPQAKDIKEKSIITPWIQDAFSRGSTTSEFEHNLSDPMMAADEMYEQTVYTSLVNYDASNMIDSEAKIDHLATQGDLYESLKEIVCFGEVIYTGLVEPIMS